MISDAQRAEYLSRELERFVKERDFADEDIWDLREWVYAGNSVYENPWHFADEYGEELSYIEARDLVFSMLEWENEHQTKKIEDTPEEELDDFDLELIKKAREALCFESALSLEEIESNFKNVDIGKGIIEGVADALRHAKGTALSREKSRQEVREISFYGYLKFLQGRE